MRNFIKSAKALMVTVAEGGNAEGRVDGLGDDVIVVLPENGSTGFVWVVGEATNGARLTESGTRRREDDVPGAMGSAYERVMRFSTNKGAPPALISLEMRRPWSDDAPARTFRLTVS